MDLVRRIARYAAIAAVAILCLLAVVWLILVVIELSKFIPAALAVVPFQGLFGTILVWALIVLVIGSVVYFVMDFLLSRKHANPGKN